MLLRNVLKEKFSKNVMILSKRLVFILGGALAALAFMPVTVSAEERGENLLLEGQSQLQQIHEAIRTRELSEQGWAEEKIYLGSLIAALKRRNEELEDQLNELGTLVEQREATWSKLEAQAARAEEITSILSPVVDSWLLRIKDLIVQTPMDLRTELGNELEVLEHYSSQDDIKQLAHRLKTLVAVLEKLNQIQAKANPVIENWKDDVLGGETVRVIYLGLGAALYQVPATMETGWYRYVKEDRKWFRVPVSGAGDVFLDYWNALESGTPYGVFNFPYPSKS